MGSSNSRGKSEDVERDKHRKMLLQRKVTTDLLEKLARSLPQVSNSLGKTLKLETEFTKELEWQGNLHYLEKWKIWKKDEATIGNLISLLKNTGTAEDVWECLFNISREPKNATTAMEASDEILIGKSFINYQEMPRKPSTACRISPMNLSNDGFPPESQTVQHMTSSARMWQRDITTASRRDNQGSSEGRNSLHQRLNHYPQESLLEDILRSHEQRESDRDIRNENKSPVNKISSLHATIGNGHF